VTVLADDTTLVLTTNPALVEPAATVALAGTVAFAVLLLERETTAPPVGAADVSVTVPCDVLPPTTVVGKTETADKVGVGGGASVITTVTVTMRSGSPTEETRRVCV
jgi:hypothetical protein